MGLLKSMKKKLSSKEDREEQNAESLHDQKYTYQPQPSSSSPEISYDDKKMFPRKQDPPSEQSYSSGGGAIDDESAYTPPPGHPPPASATTSNTTTFQSSSQTNLEEIQSNPPPYESWLAVPDNSQLPPPPSISHTSSPTNNASFDSAVAGHKWCDAHPIYTPSIPHPTILHQSQAHELNMENPITIATNPPFRGKITQIDPRTWRITSPKTQKQDTIITSVLPAYFAAVSNPLLPSSSNQHSPFQIRFTTTITSLPPSSTSSNSSSVLALGLTSKPYPPFRLPGWHRSSLAIHSDDGRRYTNDPHGGIDFISPFRVHDQIVVTFTIFPRSSPIQIQRDRGNETGLPKCVCTVEVERNGRFEGRWDVCEERDGEFDEGLDGLQGDGDLYVAVGVCGEVGCEVRFG